MDGAPNGGSKSNRFEYRPVACLVLANENGAAA
jgi:hypothetical protein